MKRVRAYFRRLGHRLWYVFWYVPFLIRYSNGTIRPCALVLAVGRSDQIWLECLKGKAQLADPNGEIIISGWTRMVYRDGMRQWQLMRDDSLNGKNPMGTAFNNNKAKARRTRIKSVDPSA